MIAIDIHEKFPVTLFSRYACDYGVISLISGDFMWEGNSETGPVLVGVERKTLPDLIQSMRKRRLSGLQMPNMVKVYSVRYLLIEGIWRPGDNGLIEIPSRKKGDDGWTAFDPPTMYQEVESYLTSIEETWNCRIHRVSTPFHTAAWVFAKYKWWQKKWEDHHSQTDIYAPGPDLRDAIGTRGRIGRRLDEGKSRAWKLVWRFASQIDGIDRKAYDIAEYFKNMTNATLSSPRQWRQITGIGKETAERICREIAGDPEEDNG